MIKKKNKKIEIHDTVGNPSNYVTIHPITATILLSLFFSRSKKSRPHFSFSRSIQELYIRSLVSIPLKILISKPSISIKGSNEGGWRGVGGR